MGVVNTSKWKFFRLGDDRYFTIKRGDSVYLKDMAPGDIPYISTTEKNNGIAAFVIDSNRKGGLISLAYDGTIGACFYQPEPFFASEKIVTIDTVDRVLTKNIAVFLITIIKLESQMYSYGGRKWTVEQQLKQTCLKLPCTSGGAIDYDYMEKYVSSLDGEVGNIPDYFLDEGYNRACWYMDSIDHEMFEKRYSESCSNSIDLNDREWSLFNLGEIFESIENGKPYNASDLVVSDSEDYVGYVTRTDKNNGVSMFVQDKDYDGLEQAGAITIGDTTSTIFYQNHRFITGPHIIVLRAKWLNVYTAMFIISMLDMEKYRYPAFGRAFTKDLIAATNVLLPADGNGNPNFRFMESYIKGCPFSCNIGQQ